MTDRIQGSDLKQWREQHDLTQEELAKELDTARPWLNKIENGHRPVSAEIQLRFAALQRDPRFTRSSREESQAPFNKLLPRRIPIISWASAGSLVSYEEIPKDWQEMVATDCEDKDAFAVYVEGESMLPDFRPGDIIIIMPSIRARNHSVVLAKFKDDACVLKVLNLTGPHGKTIRLTSINPTYMPNDYKEEEFNWIYPVHSSRRLFWR